MKVLIVRFSSIGDIVLTTPVIRAVKQQLGAEVHFLTKRSFRGILAHNPYVDKVYAIDKKISEVRAALQSEDYDYILDLHHNLRSRQVKWALSAKAYTFDKINLEKWLIVNLKVNRLPDTHIVHRYMATAAPLGAAYDGQGLDYFIPEEDEVAMGALLSTNVLGPIADAPAYTALVIGAAHNTKRLPTPRLIELCQLLEEPVILLGGSAEAEEGQAIADAGGGHVLNTCGRFNLNQSASVVRQSRRVITHDTGLMHIAAAFRKPIVSIWGNTIPEFGMYPFFPEGEGRNTTVQVEGLKCRPCSKIGYQSCPRGHFRCMEEIPLDAVQKAAEKGG
ncbi:MAG: glycosyltransferase family 9 protein [Phaeodactylibacter sp.]|uniref:glycosyltransferase family 9 protein n=1 Tax=Phaeodactylibacter sp. TaxID=1940289 RepID=UPI0032F09CF7